MANIKIQKLIGDLSDYYLVQYSEILILSVCIVTDMFRKHLGHL